MHYFSYFYNLFYDPVIVGFFLFLKLIVIKIFIHLFLIYLIVIDLEYFLYKISFFLSIFTLMSKRYVIYPYNKILLRYEKKCITDMVKE